MDVWLLAADRGIDGVQSGTTDPVAPAGLVQVTSGLNWLALDGHGK